MALRYPSWDTSKYNCLHPSLNGVRVRAVVLEKIQEQERLTKELDSLRNAVPAGNALCDSLVKMVGERIGRPISSQDRLEWVRKAVPAIQGAILEHQAYPTTSRVDGLIGELHKVYMAFNRQQFIDDFKVVFKGEKSEDHTERIEELELKVLECDEFIAREWPMTEEHMAPFFRAGHIPKAWQSLRVTPKMSDVQIGTRVIDAFMADWKERAPLFSVPVTINGIAIASLPRQADKDTWAELYNFLRLGTLPKRVFYIHRIAAQAPQTDPEVNDDLSHVPDSFKPVGRGRPKLHEGAVK